MRRGGSGQKIHRSRKLPVAPGITTSNKKLLATRASLLVTKGITTSNKGHYYEEQRTLLPGPFRPCLSFWLESPAVQRGSIRSACSLDTSRSTTLPYNFWKVRIRCSCCRIEQLDQSWHHCFGQGEGTIVPEFISHAALLLLWHCACRTQVIANPAAASLCGQCRRSVQWQSSLCRMQHVYGLDFNANGKGMESGMPRS